MIREIPVVLIDDNPLNSRVFYEEEEINQLGSSLKEEGLLVPIKVREHNNRFQLIYGHRRLKASKAIGWETIRAEVVLCTDEQMLRLSFVENERRRSLSDYEKALTFLRMHTIFNKTYEEIGKLAGLSRHHVCNYVRMTQLFDNETFTNNQELLAKLHKITEHHARIIAQIEDNDSRKTALDLVISEHLSVRETQKIIHRLRGWFGTENRHDISSDHQNEDEEVHRRDDKLGDQFVQGRWRDVKEIHSTLAAIFELPHQMDLETFMDLRVKSGFSVFCSIPPLTRFEEEQGLQVEKEWFQTIGLHTQARVREVRVRFVDQVALATLYVDFKNMNERSSTKKSIRGSVLFVKDSGYWKIFHEHWSTLDSKSSFSSDGDVFPGKHSQSPKETKPLVIHKRVSVS